MNRIRKLFKNNKADMYIEMLLCTTVMLIISVIIISMASSVNRKMWLDDQLNDIVKIVENTGCTKSDAITTIENNIKGKFGGQVTYVGDFLNESNGTVQLGDTVYVVFQADKYTALNVSLFEISTPINLSKAATSNVYYKTSATQIDTQDPSGGGFMGDIFP